MNPYMLSLDQLKAHLSSMKAEFDRRGIKVVKELVKTVKGHIQPGTVLWVVGPFGRDKWTIARRDKNTVEYKHAMPERGMTGIRHLDLKTATYSVFTSITMIKRNGKVV